MFVNTSIMDQLLFVLLVSALTGFVAGVFGSVCHQYHQRNADKKRWKELSTCPYNHRSGCRCDECSTHGKPEPKKEN